MPARSLPAARPAWLRRSVNSRIGMFSRKSASLGRVLGGIAAISPCSMAYPTPTPSAPPPSVSSRLSVSNCPKIVARAAPRALRTASSFCRVMPRASSRLATLTQAISSTKPTAPSSSHSIWIRSGGRKSFFSGSTLAPQPLSLFGYTCAICAVTASIFCCACWSVTPGFIRPITSSQ